MLTLNLSDVMYVVEAAVDPTTCAANEKVSDDGNSCSGTFCPDYKARKGNDSGNEKLCADAETTCAGAGQGVKKDGTCAASRDACKDSLKPPSAYWWIDTDNGKKCKLRAKSECTGGTSKLNIDGTCVAACNANNDNFLKDDAGTCKYDPTCTGASKGLKADGTCVADRSLCNGAGNNSWYWKVDTADLNKCKKTDKTTCTDTTTRLTIEGVCAA
jgi:hypothetical protein